MDRKPMDEQEKEFIQLLRICQEHDLDGSSSLCARVKAILTGEVKGNG